MSDPFPGARFIGASWRPGASDAVLTRLRSLTQGWSLAEGPGWLIASDKDRAFGRSSDIALGLARAFAFDRRAASFPTPSNLAAAVATQGGGALDGMAPPFRAAWADGAGGTVHARTDVFGLGHVFLGSAEGVALVASSATLVADALGAGLAPEALAAFAAFGNFLAEETPFAGVTRLPAGGAAVLREGRIEASRWGAPAASGATPAAAIRSAVAAMLQAAPDAELELSGGLDSRIILAAMQPEARRGRAAITIGVAGEASEDIAVARALAEAGALDWSTLDAGRIATLDADRLEALLTRATLGYDHMANPLDKAALIAAGEGRQVRARFGGQNGEIMRGFFYARQPLDAAPTAALARRLIAWRLTTNDAVEESLVAAPLRGELRAAAEARAADQLLALDGNWADVLDRFYLFQRMQNWVGNSAGNRTIEHVPLYPFFDPDYVAAAFATPPAEKLNSRAAYRLLGELDPALGRQPLAGGVIPARFPASRLGQKLYGMQLDLDRVVTRVKRRLGGGMATLGSQTVAQHWRRLELHKRLPLEAIGRTGLIDPSALDRIASGEWLPNRPSLGFVLLAGSLGARQ